MNNESEIKAVLTDKTEKVCDELIGVDSFIATEVLMQVIFLLVTDINAGAKLKRLFDKGYLTRIYRADPTGGTSYIYFTPKHTPKE